jgi:LL-diaminopimelate aminotransferase
MNDELKKLKAYPKARLETRKAEVLARGLRVHDFGTGDPSEPTPAFIRQALIDAVPVESRYSTVQGSSDLREATASYLRRRFEIEVEPNTEILPTSGSMEAVFHLPLILVDGNKKQNLVIYGEPAYKVFEISSLFAGARPHGHLLHDSDSYLLRPEQLGEETLSRAAMVVLNYPHNPSGQVLPPELFESWVEARDRHGFVLVSDEAYCDLYFEEPPRTLLEFGREGCLALYSLSKRSGMTGYFTGFLAGDPELIATLKRYRQSMGLSSPIWTQAAATAAWSDEAHVDERRAIFAEKRRILLEMCERLGLRVYPATAALFLWIQVPDAETDQSYAEKLLDHGILVSPGSFYGPDQERYIRVALSPTVDECREAAEVWPRV